MNNDDMVARLLEQAAGSGGDLVTLRALVEEAGELGAGRALARLGMADEAARRDLSELRELLQAWRDAKSSAWKAAIGWAVRAMLALLVVAIAWRGGMLGLLK